MEENPQDDVYPSTPSENYVAEEDALGISSSSRTARATNVPLNIRASRMMHQDEILPFGDDKSPLLGTRGGESANNEDPALQQSPTSGLLPGGLVRARKTAKRRKRRNHAREHSSVPPGTPVNRRRSYLHACLLWCCRNNSRTVQSTISCMNMLAKLLFWSTILALVSAVFWYSYELHEHG